MSFARLVLRFKEGLGTIPEREERHDPLPLATAAVLLEIGYADGYFHPNEGTDLVSYLQRAFNLSPDDAKQLIDAAQEFIDHFAHTNFIRKNSSLADRIEIVKTMWRMVYSDGKLTDYEGYLVRKLADLLGLEHHVMIDAKVSVLREFENE